MIKLWHKIMHGSRFDPLGSWCRHCRRERWQLIFRMVDRGQITYDGLSEALKERRP